MKYSLIFGFVITALLITFMNMTTALDKNRTVKIKNNANLEELEKLRKENFELSK